MGLNSSLQKVISFTAKINSAINPQNLLNVTVPGSALNKIFGFEEEEGEQTIGELVSQVTNLGGDIMTGANLVRCAFIMDRSDWGDFLGQMGMGVAGVITSIVDVIFEAVAIQIGNAVQQVVGMITSIVSALHNLWTSIELLWQSLVDLWNSFDVDIISDIDFELHEKNCKDMYAAIAGCLLNKFLGPYLNDFKEKALSSINNVGNKFNDILYEELSDAHTFAAYANQEAFLLKKAQIQIDGLRKDVLEQ